MKLWSHRGDWGGFPEDHWTAAKRREGRGCRAAQVVHFQDIIHVHGALLFNIVPLGKKDDWEIILVSTKDIK